MNGLTVLFTGLPGAGKSTLAKRLSERFEEMGRPVTLLDGDQIRTHLSSELGYSREHRELNLRRVGFVASEIARHGGTSFCALIAPYDAARKDFRAVVGSVGRFVLVYVSTPLSVCERRDVKGMYARARRGDLAIFTGISDPYEPPEDADIELDTTDMSEGEGGRRLINFLREDGLVGSEDC